MSAGGSTRVAGFGSRRSSLAKLEERLIAAERELRSLRGLLAQATRCTCPVGFFNTPDPQCPKHGTVPRKTETETELQRIDLQLKVQGHCPMGCGETLFLGAGNFITCSWHKCPNPTALADVLADPMISEHVVTFREKGFGVQHPLHERGRDLTDCALHQHIQSLSGPPGQGQLGRYLARMEDEVWVWTLL